MYVIRINEIVWFKTYLSLVNEGKDENMITGNFFLPSTDTSSIIISGSGQSSIVKSVVCKPFLKMEGITFTSEQRNCDCCLIYWLID